MASSALLLGGVVVGCGGGGTKTTIKTDGGSGDMAHAITGDLKTTQLSCSAYLDCQSSCYASDPDPATCVTNTCDANAKSTVTNSKFTGLFDKAVQCYQLYCVGPDFDMPYKCGIDFAKSTFTEVNGNPVSTGGVCETCLTEASALLFGTACKDATSMDCSTAMNSKAASACGATINACVTNK